MAKLLSWLEGAAAQINPFDGGADFNSVQRRRAEEERRRKQQQPQRPQPRPQTRQMNPLEAIGEGIVKTGVNHLNAFNQVRNGFDPAKARRDTQNVLKTVGMNPNITGLADEDKVAKQRLLNTEQARRDGRLEPLFKQGKSFEDIAQTAGYSDREVRDYSDKYHKGYGDKGIVGNIARGVGQVVPQMVRSAGGIIADPIYETERSIATKGKGKNGGNVEIGQINKDFMAGKITPEAAMERAQKQADRFTNRKVVQNKQTGELELQRGDLLDFGGKFTQQGIDTTSVLPVGGGVAQGAATVAKVAGKPVVASGLQKTANVLSAGTRSQATSKLADAMARYGMNQNTANIVGNAVTSNAKQAAVYGTAQTGADVASGRGITPESLLLNYGADFAMGALPEIGLGVSAPAIVKGGRTATDATMYAGIKRPTNLTDDELTTAMRVRQAQEGMISRNDISAEEMADYNRIQAKLGVQPGTPDAEMAVVNALGAHRNYETQRQVREQNVLEGLERANDFTRQHLIPGGTLMGPKATGFKAAQEAGMVFDGVDGKQRFEVDDSGAKYITKAQLDKEALATPNKAIVKKLSDVIDHPELYKNYPELKDVKVYYDAEVRDYYGAAYDAKANEITVGAGLNDQQIKEGVLHELQHAIQNRENFAYGATAKSATEEKAYRNSAGEAEARAVQARMNMGMGERYVPKERVRPQPTGNDFQNILPSGSRPQAVQNIVKNGGNPLYHDTSARGVLGILESGQIKPNQAAFSGLAGQSSRVSMTRNFDNYSRYGKSPYRLVVDESKTGMRAKPDNRDEFESIFTKPVNAKAIESIAIDVTNPALIDDLQRGTVAEVIQAAKAKGIRVETFEGKLLPDIEANKEIQNMTRGMFNDKFPDQAVNPQLKSTFYDSLDVPKEDLIIRNGGGKAMSIEATPAKRKEAVPAGVQAPVGRKSPTVANASSSSKLNTNRIELTSEAKDRLAKETAKVVERLSNEEITDLAKKAGIDFKSYGLAGTKKKITEQLNVRNEIFTYEKKIQAAKKAGDKELVVELMQKSAELGRISRSQGTDLARQLQARRIIADSLATPQQKLYRLFDEAGVDPEVYTKRMADVDMENPREVVKAYRELVPAKFSDWLDKYRYTNMLSSPLTHIVNITSNASGLMGVAPGQKLIEGALDAARSKVTGGPRTRFASEAGAYVKGAAKSIPEAAQKFKDVMTGRQTMDMPDADALKYGKLADGGVKGAADTILSIVPKLLEASDQFGMTLAKSGERAGLQNRMSKGVAVAKDLEGVVDDAAKYRVFRQELNAQGQGHLLEAIDFIPSVLMQARNSKNKAVSTIAKFTVPFVTTPTNLFKQGIEYSPAGVLTIAGNADKTAQLAKATMGTSVVAVAAGALASTDSITFAEPTDAKQRDAFRAEGKQPYAIKIGDKWVQYSKLHPAISFNLAMVGAVKEALDKGSIDQSTADKIMNVGGGVLGFFRDQSYMKSVGDFTSALELKDGAGLEDSIASMGSNWANQLSPFKSMVSWIGRQIDPTQRKVDYSKSAPEQIYQNLVKDIPGLNKSVPVRENPYYKDQQVPIENDNPMLNAFSPLRITNDKGYGNTTGLNITERREMYNLPDDQKPGFRENAVREKLAEKQSAKSEGGKAEKSSAKFDINDKISDNSKHLLNKFSKPKDREKWFEENNDAEYEWYKAKYENDKANGEISKAEDVKRRRMLKRDEVGSKYKKDTRDVYSLNKDDVLEYIQNDPDGNRIADELLKYDRALYDAGLTKYLKFKTGFGVSKGGRKAGGGRKKGGGKGKGSSIAKTDGKQALDTFSSTSKTRGPKTDTSTGQPQTPQMRKAVLKRYQTAGKSQYGRPIPITTRRARI